MTAKPFDNISRTLLIAVSFVVVGYILYPSFRVLVESLRTEDGFGLAHYFAFFDPEAPEGLEALWGSMFISVMSVLLCALVGVPLAFLFTRYDFPGRAALSALAIFPMLLPPLIGVIAFMFLYGASGVIPRGLQWMFGLENIPFALEGVWAILMVHTYSFYPYFYLFTANALRELDPSLAEAAKSLGGNRWFVLRKVILPLLTPSLAGAALLVFMVSMASFSAPYIFAGDYRVLSLQIYYSKLNGDMSIALTQTIILSCFSIAFLLALRSMTGRKSYVMASKGVTARQRLGGGRLMKILLALLSGGLVGVLVLPHLLIVLLSFVVNGSWTTQILPTAYTWANYAQLFQDPQTWTPIRNSLAMSTWATAAILLVGIATAYLLTRPRFRGQRLLELSVMIPWALPGTVIAMNLIVAFNVPTIWTGYQVLVNTFWILPLAYFLRHLPIVVRSSTAALEQLDPTLEEAARSLGGSWWYGFRRVIVPLAGRGILSGGILVFVMALGEFVSSQLLYTFTNRPIAIEILSQVNLQNIGNAATYSVLLILLIAATFLISQRVLKTGTGKIF
jgi:iron(III) transport system permease protein